MNMTMETARRRRRPEERPRPVRVVGDGGVTYYGRPMVKHSPWDWTVGAYIFVGGLSGGCQMLAGIARLREGEAADPMVRNARFIATAGSAIGAALLVIDLKTPHRWYNMLRIFRPTSPMSIGSYVLTTFGAASAVGAASEVVGQGSGGGRALRRLADGAQFPAALSGAVLSTYTAALLASTSTPLWAAASLPMAGHFAASAMAAGAAALSLGERAAGRSESADRLDRVALVATLVDTVFTVAADRRARAHGVQGSVDGSERSPLGKPGALALGCAVPVACHLIDRMTGRRSPVLSTIASLAILAGGYIAKSSVIEAGNRSADRPEDYARLTRPRGWHDPDAPAQRTRLGAER